MSAPAPRLAELIGALSLSTDLAAGLGHQSALKTCVLAVGLGRALGLKESALADVFYTGLLRFLGCTAYAHETAAFAAGDDNGFLGALAGVDPRQPIRVLARAWKAQPATAGTRRRVASLAALVVKTDIPHALAAAHCGLAVLLARRLDMTPAVLDALGQMYERWDGRGNPNHLRGDAIAPPARILHLAWETTALLATSRLDDVLEVVKLRRGKGYEPAVVDAFVANAGQLTAPLQQPSVWSEFLASEPTPHRQLGQRLEVATTFAAYVDAKSPWTLGHSRGVSELVATAAALDATTSSQAELLRLAGLLHDLGRTGVPNGIWDKPGPLDAIEWARVRQHAVLTREILSLTPLLADVAAVAGADHERTDGQGYPGGGRELSGPSALLAAADVYTALTEARPYRPARLSLDAANELAATPGLDAVAVDQVLTAAGQRGARRFRGELPARLTARELEVLELVALGRSNKEIGTALGISAKTAQHHVAHIFEKIGASNRAGAASYAVAHGLVRT